MKNLKISAKDLKVGYSQKLVLDNINFELVEHDFVSIIGPNGTGKTTLLKTLSQYLKPKDGSIYLNNKDLNEFSKKDLSKIRAFVSAEEKINTEMISVYQYLTFGRVPHQNIFGTLKNSDYEIIEKVIQDTGIENFIEKNILELSSGEKQRVQIARALVQEPSILLLDEPTSHLDINYQLGIMNLLKEISQKGVIIITILHDLNLASYFCTKLLLLSEKNIVSFDTPQKVLTEKNLEKVFKNKWEIIYNPITNNTKVYPKIESEIEQFNYSGKLHIVGGGGSATESLKFLKHTDFEISLGIINIMDTDYITAKELDIKIITEEPFSKIQENTRLSLRKHLETVDYIYLTKFPFGDGNISNLEEIIIAKNNGKKIIIEENDFKDRDFTTENKATKLWNELIPDYNSLIDFLKVFDKGKKKDN